MVTNFIEEYSVCASIETVSFIQWPSDFSSMYLVPCYDLVNVPKSSL